MTSLLYGLRSGLDELNCEIQERTGVLTGINCSAVTWDAPLILTPFYVSVVVEVYSSFKQKIPLSF